MARYLCPPFLVLILLLSGGSAPAAPAGASQATAQISGDVNCDAAVNSIDSLQILRSVAGLSTSAACLADAGDVNCDDAVNSIDSLRILRYVAGLSNTTPDGCVPIGEPLAPPPTSEELIAAALEASEITYDESLLYRAYALHDLPGLPEEFRSPVIDMHAGGELSVEIEANRDSLSQQTLDTIAPIMARPNDPISIFNNPPQGASNALAASGPDWKGMSAAGGLARVWMKGGTDVQLTEYSIAVNQVWVSLSGIFRYPNPDVAEVPSEGVNPDTAIDLYFVDLTTVDPRLANCASTPTDPNCSVGVSRGGYAGFASSNTGNGSSGYVLLRTDFQGDALRAGIAHELMHVSQYAYDQKENWWLMDSTAHWGAARVMEKLGRNKDYLYQGMQPFFDGLDQTLTRDVGLNRYASWVYFLFASMEKGDGIVTTIWEKAAAAGVQNAEAVNDAFPFLGNFDDFALRNWNQKPPLVKWYRDGGGDSTFPTNLAPKTKPWFFTFDEERKETDAINPLASIYYRYTFHDLVRKVKFNKIITGNPNVRVWALVKIGDTWKPPEDWSGKVVQTFCRDLPDQNVTELVLIFSNSSMTNPVPAGDKLKMETHTEGCAGWVGTTTGVSYYRCCSGSANSSDGSQILETRTTFTGLWEEDPTFLYGPGCNCTALFPTGTIDWSVDYRVESECCTCSDLVTGHLEAGTGLQHITQQMMIRWDDPSDPSQSIYSGAGMLPIDAFIDCDGGFTYPVMDFFYLNPTLDLATPSPTPTPTPVATPNPSPTLPPPDLRARVAANGTASCDQTQFKVADTATTFSGSCYRTFENELSYERFQWSFTRVEVIHP